MAGISAVRAVGPHTDGMNILPGRAAPSQTLPPGNRVSPAPCARARPAPTLPRAGVWGNPVSPRPLRAGYALPIPPTG